MTHTFSIAPGEKKTQLRMSLCMAAATIGSEYTVDEVLVIRTESEPLAKVIEGLISNMPTWHGYLVDPDPAPERPAESNAVMQGIPGSSEQAEAAEVVPVQVAERAGEKICPYCGKAFSGRGKICGAPECKKQYAREYARQYAKKLKGEPKAKETREAPAEAERPFEPEKAEVWPVGATWKVDDPLGPMYLAQWELEEMIEDGSLTVETQLTHVNKGLHRLVRKNGKLRPVLAAVSGTAAVPDPAEQLEEWA